MNGFHGAILDHGDAAVLVLDRDDLSVRWASSAARRLFAEARGLFPDLVSAQDAAAVGTFLHGATTTAARCTCTVEVEGTDHRHIDLVVRDLSADSDIGGLVVVASDVTGWAETTAELGRKLNTDPKTGLANWTGFRVRLDQAVRGAPNAALLYLDIDQFKVLNDRFGHAAGDEALRLIGSRLTALVADRGTAARVGGDEFAVLLDQASGEDAVRAAEKLQAAIDSPMSGTIRVTVSIGITAVLPGRRPETLLRQADLAMYRAKAMGRGRVERFSENLEDWALARKQQVRQLAERLEQLHAENQALAEAAIIDQRTGLLNPAAFEADHARYNNEAESYGLLLIDIDHFHSYNTIYRYLAGHETLRKVGQTIRNTVRAGDRTYRYGGEEFMVLVPDAGLRDVLALGDQVRREVQRLGVEHRGNPGGVVSVSVGAVEVGPSATVTEAVEEASVAVLAAKDSGRNTVVGRRTGTDRPLP